MPMPAKMLKKALARLGYQLVRNGRLAPNTYDALIEELLEVRGRISVAVIGANDGKIADPMYRISKRLGSRMDIMLIEPQAKLIPHLETNYGHQSSKSIFNGAVGPVGKLRLYAIREEFWHTLRVPYARGWPLYRAPTGVTSFDRDRVVAWFQRYHVGSISADIAVEALEVRSMPLVGVMAALGFQPTLDVVQVDAEGSDDLVLFNSDVDITRPRIIRYERREMSADREATLRAWLRGRGYAILDDGGDAIALRLCPTT